MQTHNVPFTPAVCISLYWEPVVRTFTCITIPEYAFWTEAIALDFVDWWSSPHAVDASSGEGVWQGCGGLVRLFLVQLLPGEFRGRMVKWFRTHAGLGSVVAGSDEGMCVIGLNGTANAFGGWREALQGHWVLVPFGWVHHHGVWVLLRKRLLVGIH